MDKYSYVEDNERRNLKKGKLLKTKEARQDSKARRDSRDVKIGKKNTAGVSKNVRGLRTPEGRNMTKEQLAKYKSGGRNSGSDSAYSYRSIYTPGGTRHVRRRRRRSDGNYSDSESYDSEKDLKGKERRMQRRVLREEQEQRMKEEIERAREILNSAHSYYSFVSDGGTRHVKRRKRHEDGTYSDSESCDEDMLEHYEDVKKAKEILGEDIEGSKKRHWKKKRKDIAVDLEAEQHAASSPDCQNMKLQAEGNTSPVYSVHSDVSEGGTRRRYRRKVLRDDDGNVIGFGSPELYMSPGESDEESVRIRRGSISEDDYLTETARGKKDLRRLQRMIERPLRRPGLQKQGDVPGKRGAWIEEALEGLPLKQRQFQKTSEQAESNGLDVHGLDMPTAGPRSRRRSSLAGIEEDDYFSDSSEEEPDLSAMTEEERKEYLEAREKRRQEREKRMREKFGDKYDEMKRKKREQREAETRAKAEAAAVAAAAAAAAAAEAAAEDGSETAKGRGTSGPIRDLSTLQSKARQKPKSMVSYERGPAREVGGTIEKTDARDIGPSHSNWTKKTPRARDMPRKSRDEGFNFEFKPSKMPSIKLNIGDDKDVRRQSRAAQGHRVSFLENPDEVEPEEDKGRDSQLGDLGVFEMGEDGKLRVKAGEEIDLKRISSAVLRRLGIDPKLSTDEIVKQLKEKLGRDVVVKDGVFAIGTKPITAYDLSKVTDEMLAEDPELDINTLKGPRRVNVLMQRGGSELREHLHRVMNQCRMQGKIGYAKDLDETDSSIDFLSHYRLVDPGKLEGYARAFVVEDRDLDTVINFLETQTALDGVTSIQHMTSKQIQYVLKVLDIDDASQVTFRMFAVITALCERVTQMDSISKHYLEICNLADIERKLDLYKAMFYHNVGSDRQTNFITSESLKIELIAGGLNWKQQEYIMEKMEPNSWGEISFLDYMCYIPLFMSMHDNICDNPLDMSDQKYVMPPRQRPPSPQRDMNPLGNALSKFSSFLMKKQARDLKDGKLDPKVVREEQLTVLKSYAKLPDIDTFDKPKYNEDEEYETIDLIY